MSTNWLNQRLTLIQIERDSTMYVDHLPQDSSDRILDVIKSSNLHFNIQETPHSVYITIRKKFVRESPVKMSNHVIVAQKLASLEEANSNLRNDLEEEIDSHRESRNIVKILEDKLEKAEAQFIEESAKFKAEKEKFEEKINLQKDSKKKSTVSFNASEAKDKQGNFNSGEKADKLIEKIKISQNLDQNQNTFIVDIPVSNQFQALQDPESSNLDEISTLSRTSTFDLPSSAPPSSSTPNIRSSPNRSKTLSTEPNTRTPSRTTLQTPPPQDLKLGFKNFLEDFRNEDGDFKYLKIAKEMIIYNRNVMQIQMEDILKHNQFLSDEIRNDYYGVFNSLTTAFRNFMHDNVDSTSEKEYHILLDK